MQVKDGFLLRKVGEQYIVAPTGDLSREFNGMLRLNCVGAFLFERLMAPVTEDELVSALTESYDTTDIRARADVRAFIKTLKQADLMKGD